MGANAMESAIRMPPQAMNGIANETPVNKCCRKFLSNSGIEVQCYKKNFVHCSCKTAHPLVKATLSDADGLSMSQHGVPKDTAS
jgi:hypothetical protein